jgi:aminoglycoside phosphotransferase family enzyme/predicted kinase
LPDRRSSSRRARQGKVPDPTTEELIEALRLTDAYPHRPESVGFQQTQMSLVFLAGEFVYKVKKPVNLGYLDYTSLDARRAFCEKEVLLNRRLCASAYLGVVPVVRRGSRLVVEGAGEAVEYAVKMRRLPADRMLDHLLTAGTATAPMLQGVARRLASFHGSGETTEEVSAFGRLSAIRGNTDENFEQTVEYIGRTVTRATHSLLRRYTDDFLDSHARLLESRVGEERIRDCHGDLHAAHVCMTDDICIYDCIEFNDRFRYGDTASEVAFLAMDLDRYSRRDLSSEFVNSYIEASGDGGLAAVLDFYKCYRAFVRGKVEGFRSVDSMSTVDEKDAARWRARRYFQLARGYATGRGRLIIMSGLSGSGKSRVAGELADRLGCSIIASDVVRKELAGLLPSEPRREPFGEGLYSEEWTRRTYEELARRAASMLERGLCVIIDASFLLAWQRRTALAMARQVGVRPVLAECTAPHATLVDRLVRRTSISDARPEILDGQLKTREAIAENEESDHVVLDTERAPADSVEELWGHL